MCLQRKVLSGEEAAVDMERAIVTELENMCSISSTGIQEVTSPKPS